MRIFRGTFLILCSITLFSCRSAFQVDKPFTIGLENNGLGGYQWEYIEIPEVVVVDSLDQPHKQENGFLEYTRVYRMKGLERGRYNIRFVKKRSFESRDSIKLENIRNFKVRIRK